MQAESANPAILADDVGIHFLRTERDDIVVHWGEIESVDAARCNSADGSSCLEIYINHISGVDFRFYNVEEGYEQVMALMERKLVGFSRIQAEAAGTWDQKLDTPVIWKRDETIQPFELRPPKMDQRAPTTEEITQMKEAHQASIATCEKLLGRPLEASEHECVYTGFENGRIVGHIAYPLCELLTSKH